MKIFTAEQIREADKYTMEKEGISSIELMERAAGGCISKMMGEWLDNDKEVIIFCGLGNNGGDGLAIARILSESEVNVKAIIVNYSDKRSKDFSINYSLIKVSIHK